MKEIVWDLIRDIKYYFEYDKNFYPRGLRIIIPWGYFWDILKSKFVSPEIGDFRTSGDFYPWGLGIFKIWGF